jgi:hypothetical protein
MKWRFPFPFLSMVLVFICFSCKKSKEEEKNGIPLGTCKPVAAQGSLSQATAGAPFVYKTADGWTITIHLKNSIKIQHDTYQHYNLELWGIVESGELSGNHENLNGKHLKDRLSNKRSIVLPEGTKITMHAQDIYYSRLTMVSIYDGAQVHHINAICGILEYSNNDAAIAKELDDRQADGETAAFEMTEDGIILVNIYNENSPGNKVTERVLLGGLEKSRPNLVNDFFDDPRIAHT